ncbi:MAG: hypothetical protein IT434_16555 [Phycisphaerales bacterium]|nr:hypothetical protein [Phycisphaerales bacterium]
MRTTAHAIRRTRTLFFFVIPVTTPTRIRAAEKPTSRDARRAAVVRPRTRALTTT